MLMMSIMTTTSTIEDHAYLFLIYGKDYRETSPETVRETGESFLMTKSCL